MHSRNQEKDFRCAHCHQMVSACGGGTSHRNHCPYCLYSRHVDINKGDRKADCGAPMAPIALAFKGGSELCVVHKCTRRDCNKVNYNRIASDDSGYMLEKVYEASLRLSNEEICKLQVAGIHVLTRENAESLKIQLYGFV